MTQGAAIGGRANHVTSRGKVTMSERKLHRRNLLEKENLHADAYGFGLVDQ